MTDEEIVDALAQLLWLEIDTAHRPGVVANMTILRDHARRVLDFPIDEHADCTDAFRP